MDKNIKLIYSFDGSEFFGFQRQPNLRTVQGEIEKILKLIFKKDINLISAGRTDKGVHAKIQVSNFIVDTTIPIERIKRVIESKLPNDIAIHSVKEVTPDFNSRFSAKTRAYEYYITDKKDVFNSRYTTYIDRELDVEILNEIIKPLVGVHNFSNFRLLDCSSKSAIREIYIARFEKIDENRVRFYVKGNSFLKSQIRIIVGTVLNIYLNRQSKNYLEEMLNNPDKRFIKYVAEPYGLHLCEINY